jgi:hypothetical protein
MSNQIALPLVLAVGGFFLVWYIAGNELMRRRARRLALWSRGALEPAGGVLMIQWLALSAFRMEVREPRPPLQSGTLTGLVESWDVAPLWLWNRLRGRRDMVLLQCVLRRSPAFDFELYRPRSLLAGDVRHIVRREQWPEEPSEEFHMASPVADAYGIAGRLLAELGAQRDHLLRLAVRRRGTHLTLAMNLSNPAHVEPAGFYQLACRLAEAVASSGAPSS